MGLMKAGGTAKRLSVAIFITLLKTEIQFMMTSVMS